MHTIKLIVFSFFWYPFIYIYYEKKQIKNFLKYLKKIEKSFLYYINMENTNTINNNETKLRALQPSAASDFYIFHLTQVVLNCSSFISKLGGYIIEQSMVVI
jgi:hypothetical protein